jgi:DNA-binding GntR family transcriptional regulator
MTTLSGTTGSPKFDLGSLAKPESRYRISDAVFQTVSEAIRNLKLPPGAPISETGIATQLQVSRSPVREAFTRLTDQGLIVVVPQVGGQVAPISLQEVADAVFIRTALETSAFQRAIGAGTPDTTGIQRLADANRAAAENKDIDAFFDTDEQLHQGVFELAGVPRMWQLVRGTKMQLDRLRRLNLHKAVHQPELCDEHQHIVDALRDRDEAAGIAVIRNHATRVLDLVHTYRTENPTYFTD